MIPQDTFTGLVWITQRHAINPAAICSVFHGRGGELLVRLAAGDPLHLAERDLTSAGRDLLLPAAHEQHSGDRASPHVMQWPATLAPTFDK
jgi:hypothetical protein